jgi:hypothetical protein
LKRQQEETISKLNDKVKSLELRLTGQSKLVKVRDPRDFDVIHWKGFAGKDQRERLTNTNVTRSASQQTSEL